MASLSFDNGFLPTWMPDDPVGDAYKARQLQSVGNTAATTAQATAEAANPGMVAFKAQQAALKAKAAAPAPVAPAPAAPAPVAAAPVAPVPSGVRSTNQDMLAGADAGWDTRLNANGAVMYSRPGAQVNSVDMTNARLPTGANPTAMTTDQANAFWRDQTVNQERQKVVSAAYDQILNNQRGAGDSLGDIFAKGAATHQAMATLKGTEGGDAAVRVQNAHNAGAAAAADIAGHYGVQEHQIGADATRYSADQQLAGTGVTAAAHERATAGTNSTTQLGDLLRFYGTASTNANTIAYNQAKEARENTKVIPVDDGVGGKTLVREYGGSPITGQGLIPSGGAASGTAMIQQLAANPQRLQTVLQTLSPAEQTQLKGAIATLQGAK